MEVLRASDRLQCGIAYDELPSRSGRIVPSSLSKVYRPKDESTKNRGRLRLSIDVLFHLSRPHTGARAIMAFLILVIGDIHIPDRALDIPPKVSQGALKGRSLC